MQNVVEKIVIRKLDRGDVEAFKVLRIAAVQNSPHSISFSIADLNSMSLADFQTQLHSASGNAVFGAWLNGELIGIAGLQRDEREKIRHKAKIWGVYASAAHRGRGVARQLMSAALEEAKSQSEIVGLNLSVHANNHAAKSLYASFGFRRWGIEPNSICVDGEFVDEEHMHLELGGR
jgi:ribosomal protein S18 acetylase RimI-like enzyme